MPICNECNYCDFQPAPGEFFETTEEQVMQWAAEGQWDQAEIDEAMADIGNLMCPECGSSNVLSD